MDDSRSSDKSDPIEYLSSHCMQEVEDDEKAAETAPEIQNEISTNKKERIIGNYQLLNYIGEGSFGKVYLCKRIGDDSGKLFAMKVQDKKKID